MTEMLPPGGTAALAAWGGAYAVVVGLALLWSRGLPRRRAAFGWTLLATAFPGAWLSAYEVGPVLAERAGRETIAVALVAFTGYGAILWFVRVLGDALLESTESPESASGSTSRSISRSRSRPMSTPRSRVPSPSPDLAPPGDRGLPTIRPAGGGVAAGGFAGSGPEIERDGLLRVLKKGPDFQTSAAAKGLAVAWAGTRDRSTLDAFIDVLRNESVADEVRAEVWIALRKVLGDSPTWEEEADLRLTFPEGVDWDRVDALDAELHPDPAGA